MTILVVELDDAERHLFLDLCAQAECEAVGVWESRAALHYLQRAAAPAWVILLDLRIAQSDDAICATLRAQSKPPGHSDRDHIRQVKHRQAGGQARYRGVSDQTICG